MRRRKHHVRSSKSPLLDASVALENIASFASSCRQVDYLLKRCQNTSRGLRSGRLKSRPWSSCFGLGFVRSAWEVMATGATQGKTRYIYTTYYVYIGWKCPYHSTLSSLHSNCPQLVLSHPLSQAAAIVHSPHFLPARLKPPQARVHWHHWQMFRNCRHLHHQVSSQCNYHKQIHSRDISGQKCSGWKWIKPPADDDRQMCCYFVHYSKWSTKHWKTTGNGTVRTSSLWQNKQTPHVWWHQLTKISYINHIIG